MSKHSATIETHPEYLAPVLEAIDAKTERIQAELDDGDLSNTDEIALLAKLMTLRCAAVDVEAAISTAKRSNRIGSV